MRLYLFFLHVVLFGQSVNGTTSAGRFYYPDDNGPGVDYSEDDVWTIGATKNIRWTTTYSNYTIALWQQILPGGPATLGNVIFQTTAGAVTEFDWVVQIFDFNLESSNVFFLWIHEGLPSEQGAADATSITSHYVNFTLAVHVTTQSTSASPTTTSSSLSINSKTTQEIVTASTEALSTSSSISAMATQTPTATSTPASSQASGSTLSTGAQAGIGIGASLIGIAAIAACGIFVWRPRKRHTKEVGRQVVADDPPGDSFAQDDKAVTVTQGYDLKPKMQGKYTVGPAELSSFNEIEPVELYGDYPGRGLLPHGAGIHEEDTYMYEL